MAIQDINGFFVGVREERSTDRAGSRWLCFQHVLFVAEEPTEEALGCETAFWMK